ncbi:MAG: hypothetical protein DCC71_21925 [Proteobacteria bacterium]|nr:MAG: hypothetical protein DCC71_21925 [Pseudomonadota bacterium]
MKHALPTILIAACLLAPAPASAAARDAAALERANGMLAEKAQWDAAIAIYRSLLDADPDWIEPRHRLASVLAWRGEYDEALAHMDRLAAAPDAPPDVAIVRAEVLSWTGRTQEARTAFEHRLAAQPGDARAARGLARTLRWSGERGAADRWYGRALALEDDAEARREHEAMRAELGRELRGGGRVFFDSEDFSYWRSDARFALDWDFDTRLYASSATLLVRHEREAGAVLDGAPESARGIESRLGVERRLGARTKGFVELGARVWEHADDVPLARAGVEWTPRENTSLSFELSHDDMLERSYSLESVLENVRRRGGKASLWRQLTPSTELYAESGGAWISGGNGETYGGASLSWRPFAAHEVRLALAVDASRYQERSDFYYSPAVDLGTTLSLFGRIPIRGPLAFTFDVGGGGGLSRETDATEVGPAYRAKAGLSFRRGGFTLELDGARSQSVRAIAYTTHEVTLRAGWSF